MKFCKKKIKNDNALEDEDNKKKREKYFETYFEMIIYMMIITNPVFYAKSLQHLSEIYQQFLHVLIKARKFFMLCK